MSKETKQKQKDMEIQAKAEELLAKIDAQREAEPEKSQEKNANIEAAKIKLAQAYMKLVNKNQPRKQPDRNAESKPARPVKKYTQEEKEQILKRNKELVARWNEYKDRMEKRNKRDNEEFVDIDDNDQE